MMNGLWLCLSILTLSLNSRLGDAFVFPRPVNLSVRKGDGMRQSILRDRHVASFSQPRILEGKGANTETSNKSPNKALFIPFFLALRDAMAPALDLALANEWQINLIKHVLTIISARFVLKTLLELKQTKFQWSNISKYLLAAGLVVAGGLWVDAVFVIPYYGINLIQHAVCLWGVAAVLKLVMPRFKTATTVEPTKKKEKKTVAVAVPKVVPPPPPVVDDEPVTEKEVKEEPPPITVETEMKQDEVVAEPEPETATKEKNLVYYLTNIQEELAEIQLVRIPEFFSQEAYDKAQKQITTFQLEKVQDFFEIREYGDNE